MRVAESILFAGKAIRILRNPSPAFRFQDSVFQPQIPKGSHKVQGFLGRFAFQKQPCSDAKLIGEELLPQSEADKIDAMLQELKVFVCLVILIISALIHLNGMCIILKFIRAYKAQLFNHIFFILVVIVFPLTMISFYTKALAFSSSIRLHLCRNQLSSIRGRLNMLLIPFAPSQLVIFGR